ncbi:hypothetical protein [Streptomyces sp. NPDC048565]|uniref:hypothetical protein n=1 Tax=Streptomyces sp. NPDC048565 TaxID=3155266 RepID=UPI003432745E
MREDLGCLAQGILVDEAIDRVIGVLEVGTHGEQDVRGDLQHEHPALCVDAYEDRDDQFLVPPGDPQRVRIHPDVRARNIDEVSHCTGGASPCTGRSSLCVDKDGQSRLSPLTPR